MFWKLLSACQGSLTYLFVVYRDEIWKDIKVGDEYGCFAATGMLNISSLNSRIN